MPEKNQRYTHDDKSQGDESQGDESQGDKSAVLRIQAGDSLEMGALYDRYVHRIFAFHLNRVLHQHDAEDLTSMTFMKVVEKINTYNPRKSSFNTWIYTVARNTLYDFIRTKKKVVDIAEIADAPDATSHDSVGKQQDDAIQLERVYRLLETIPQAQRDIIIMRVWDGLSYKEIAGIVGKSEANCKMIVSRILKKIRTERREHLLALFIVSYVIYSMYERII